MYDLVLAVCGLAVWGWFWWSGRRAVPREPVLTATWGGREVALVGLAFYAAIGGCSALMTVVAGLPLEKMDQVPFALRVAGAALANATTVALALALAARGGRGGLAAAGIRTPGGGAAEQVLLGLLGFFAVLPAIVAVSLVVQYVAWHFHYEIKPQEVVEIFVRRTRPSGFAFILFYALVGAPVMEEVLFRGFLQGYLRRRMPAAAAVFLSALTFAFFHAPLHAAVAVFFLGLVLGFLRNRTQSLIAPIVAHVLFNLHTVATTQVLR